MSKQSVNQVIQRAISDGAFRRQLQRDPSGALAGFDLTTDERAAITSGDPTRLTALGVDQRMSKAFGLGGMSDASKSVIGDTGSAGTAAFIDEGSAAGTSAIISPNAGEGGTMVVADPNAEELLRADDAGADASSSVIVGDPLGRAPAAFEPDAGWSGSESVLPPEDAAATVTAFEPGAGWSGSEALLPPEDAAAAAGTTAFEPGAGWSGSEAVLPPEDAAATETLEVDSGGDIQPTEY